MDLKVWEIIKWDTLPEKRLDVRLLKECTTRLSFAMARGLRWERVNELHLFGTESSKHIPVTEGQLEPGVYVDASGSWVMIYGLNSGEIPWYLTRGFQRLSILEIYNTTITSLDVSMLSQLRSLCLAGNPLLAKIFGLDRLENLRVLRVRESGLKTIRFTDQQRQLALLDLCQNPALEYVLGLEHLQSMEHIDLNETALRTISLSKTLEKLKYLKCCGTPLEEGTFLSMIPMLEHANLQYTKLTRIPSLERLYHLCTLDLRGSPIETLEGVGFPENLEIIWLDYTKIRYIPDSVRNLKKLRGLELSGLTLAALPDWLPELIRQNRQNNRPFSFFLKDTTVDGVDMNALGWVGEDILEWIRDRKAEQQRAAAAAPAKTEPQPVNNSAAAPGGDQRDWEIPETAEQKKLIEDLRLACEKLQDRPLYWGVTEDERTDFLRDLLLTGGYTVLDQHRGGVSTGGERAGELDLDIRLKANASWTVLEALNLKSSSPSQLRYWDAHLDKLLDNYNPVGRAFLFHVSYVGCAKDKFTMLCGALFEHLRRYSPEGFQVIPQTAREIGLVRSEEHQNRFMRMFKCAYNCGGARMTVYHFFVRMGE